MLGQKYLPLVLGGWMGERNRHACDLEVGLVAVATNVISLCWGSDPKTIMIFVFSLWDLQLDKKNLIYTNKEMSS